MFLFFLFFSPTLAADIIGTGTIAYLPFLQQAAMAYQLIDPSFNFTFIPTATTQIGIANMVNDSSISLVLSEGTKPTPTQYQLGFQLFPFVSLAVVVQINFPFDILLNRSVLADIYMGNVTNWNDSKITSTNPGVPLPNATIKVFWRNDNVGYNNLWSTVLSAFSDIWNQTIGVTSYWPSQNYSNFYVTTSNPSENGAIAYTKNSMGFINYYMVARDPAYHYVRLYHKYTHQPMQCNGTSLEAATSTIPLKPDLSGSSSIDSPDPAAWPVGTLGFLIVSTNPKNCDTARSLYRFLRWFLSSPSSRAAVGLKGGGPLSANHTNVVLNHLKIIKCDGKEVGSYENLWSFESLDAFFFTITALVLFIGLMLSSIHIYYFSYSKINIIYSIVFVIGTTLTLLSPIFWFFPPEQDSICLTRLWTGSLGFAILLGTMFSRTWQLNDIYQLQKYKMDTLRFQTTTSKTLNQLAITLSGVIFTNLLILTIWSAVDPLSPFFVVVDEEALTGYYTCTSNDMATWATLELIFFLSLLLFGIYVIYNTWSFQRQTLLVETRWVLLALYNVVLNIFAVLPILVLTNITEKILSLIVVASIDLSGTSIICAVLLPRLLQKLDSSKSEGTATGDSIRSPTNINSRREKEKEKEMSRTPEDELAKRLEEPLPLTNKCGTSELELGSYPTSSSPSSRETITESTHFVALSPLRREPIAEEASEGEDGTSPGLPSRKKSSPETPSKPRKVEDSPSGMESEAELLRGMDGTSGGDRMYVI